MNSDKFFPSRIIYFLLTLLIAMVIDSPFIMLIKDLNEGLSQTLFFALFCTTFIIVVAAINVKKRNNILPYYTKNLDSLWLAMLIVFVIQTLISQPAITLLNEKATTNTYDSCTIIGSLIFAPILEETIFRGILLRGLLTRYSTPIAITLSTLLFALIHINMNQIIPAFLLGILFGLVFAKTHSFIFTAILHFEANAITWLFAFSNSEKIYQALDYRILLAILILSIPLYCYGCITISKKLRR